MKDEVILPGWPKGMTPPDYSGDNFLEMLANQANNKKVVLIDKLLALVQSGDSTAWRILEKALIETKPKSDKDKPIPILGGITQSKELINNEKEKI